MDPMCEDYTNCKDVEECRDQFVRIGDIIDFYKNDFKDLDDGVHWSRSDIIHNLLSVPRFKAERVTCAYNIKLILP